MFELREAVHHLEIEQHETPSLFSELLHAWLHEGATKVTTAAIIQARTGSTRLPGKVLRLLPRTPAACGKGGAPQTILAHVINRAQAIPGIDIVCVATSDRPEDDRIAHLARAAGARVARGSERDVLGRFVIAAETIGADVIVRLTADCPLLDPLVAGEVLRVFRERRRRGVWATAYASNVHPPSWYDGNDVETFDRRTLLAAAAAAGNGAREHVTTWMVEHALDIVNVRCPDGADRSAIKLSVDTAADYERVCRTYAALSDRRQFGWREVLAAYVRAYPHPAIVRARRIFWPTRHGRSGNRRRSTALIDAFVIGGRDAAAGRPSAPPMDFRASAYRLGYEDVAELRHEAAP